MYKNEYTLCCLPSSFIDFEWYIRCIWLFLFKPGTISLFQSNVRLCVASSLKLIRHSHWIEIVKRLFQINSKIGAKIHVLCPFQCVEDDLVGQTL